jgi:hypothetical protein
MVWPWDSGYIKIYSSLHHSSHKRNINEGLCKILEFSYHRTGCWLTLTPIASILGLVGNLRCPENQPECYLFAPSTAGLLQDCGIQYQLPRVNPLCASFILIPSACQVGVPMPHESCPGHFDGWESTNSQANQFSTVEGSASSFWKKLDSKYFRLTTWHLWQLFNGPEHPQTDK